MTTYAINANTFGISHYTGGFSGIVGVADLDGTTVVMRSDGLYEHTGSDDFGSDIDAHIKTGKLTFGYQWYKTMPRDYLSFTADGNLLVKAIGERRGEQITCERTVGVRATGFVRNEGIKLCRGLVADSFKREIYNVDGADFDLNLWKVKVNPLPKTVHT